MTTERIFYWIEIAIFNTVFWTVVAALTGRCIWNIVYAQPQNWWEVAWLVVLEVMMAYSLDMYATKHPDVKG